MPPEVLVSIENANHTVSGRRFPGLSAPHPSLCQIIATRESGFLQLSAGDIVSISLLDGDATPHVVAFDDRGSCALSTLGLATNGSLSTGDFDSERMSAWIAAQGVKADENLTSHCLTMPDEPLVLRAEQSCSVWIVNALTAQDMIWVGGTGRLKIDLRRAFSGSPILPAPLGDIRDEFTVSRATAQAYELKKGEVVQIIDVDGQQCSDFMVFRADALQAGQEMMFDSTVTRTFVGGAYPRPGLFDKFLDSDMRPMLNLVQDTVGRHDTFALACTARGYEERGFPGHVNCSDNISDALEPYGVKRRRAWPAINFFFNSWIDRSDNLIQSEEAWSRPGDFVALRALDDMVCVSTACPDDIDPINGWNPTDVHVRIYRPDTPIRRAVAYREKEDNVLAISQESPFHSRTSALTQHFRPARDIWVPMAYSSVGTLKEYWTCRNAVTVQDMSGLRKFDIVGPDAEKLLQQALTRDVAKLPVWRGTYALLCDERGAVIDDGTLFRLGPDLFRWCCGSEESGRVLAALAKDIPLQVRVTALGGSLPNLAIQGPKSRDLLRDIVFTQPHVPSLDELKWFGVTIARLHDRDGAPFMISRSGYTGELGYEIFCDKSHALDLWDAVMEAGEPHGINPMGDAALEIMRIEAGLMAAGAEFGPDVDAYEAGLGFAIDMRKPEFTGRAALERNAAAPRRVLRGLRLETDDLPAYGQHVYYNERPVGVVTSGTRSPQLECGIAMARIAIEQSETGTQLEIGQMDGHMKRLVATVVDVPFVDPKRTRARA